MASAGVQFRRKKGAILNDIAGTRPPKSGIGLLENTSAQSILKMSKSSFESRHRQIHSLNNFWITMDFLVKAANTEREIWA